MMLQLFDTLYSFDYDGDLSPYLMAEEKRTTRWPWATSAGPKRSWSSGSPGRSESGWKLFCAIRRRQGRRGSGCPSGGDWCWGSSWGRWRGGRNFAARRRGTAGGPGVPPIQRKMERAVNDLWERESPRRFAPPLLTRGDFSGRGISGGAFSCSKSHLSREHPHPSGLRPATFPLEGGRLSDGRKGRPLRRNRTGSVGSVK